MPKPEITVAELVAYARCGDPRGLEGLVTRFQNMAAGYAFSRLGDVERSRDAVQEAFIDAHLRLDQLQQAAAFGAWLRRIVHKHCDRITRRAQPVRSHDGALEALDPAATPEKALAAAKRSAWLRGAIEDLPEHERAAVALHYLAGHSQAETASFLGLELSAVKKRLFSARQRLKDRSAVMNNPQVDLSHPQLPAMPSVAPSVALFLAIRAGDHPQVRQLLLKHPKLLEGEERWSDDEALRSEGEVALSW